MKRACVIGWPIEHSRSPLIHGHWLTRYGIEGTYTKVAVRPEEVAEFLRALSGHGYVGCNVTAPHKEAAFRAAARVEEDARVVGVANTLWLEDGVLRATNTDTYGYMAHLSRSAPDWKGAGSVAAVIGAGGAARAIVYGLIRAGVRQVRVFNRSLERAQGLAADLGGDRVRACSLDGLDDGIADAGLIVNTTTLGQKGQPPLDVDLARAPSSCVVSDIVYVPLETPLLAAARRRGLVAVDGLGMLLHQAVPGFERWFGVRPEVTEELRAVIVADIEGRR